MGVHGFFLFCADENILILGLLELLNGDLPEVLTAAFLGLLNAAGDLDLCFMGMWVLLLLLLLCV